jgi:alpha-L-fucosidase 2
LTVKGVAKFWLSQLQEDMYFNDGTLVVNPCNSAEQGPTTFGCTHYQQLIHQVFESILSGADLAGETNSTFVQLVSQALGKLDKGVHIGDWGNIKEWKMPDTQGYDYQGNTHRHLSHLVGWYPGWSISSFEGGYANETIRLAVNTSLTSRGPGIADQDTGWQKVWRAACWARLNNAGIAYSELKLAIWHNFFNNGFSMYYGRTRTGGDPAVPFQIDANFGFTGAVASMLVVDLPTAMGVVGRRTVVLGPAIPTSWGNGSVKGLRLRGGGSVDFSWDQEGIVTKASTSGPVTCNLVNVNGDTL